MQTVQASIVVIDSMLAPRKHSACACDSHAQVAGARHADAHRAEQRRSQTLVRLIADTVKMSPSFAQVTQWCLHPLAPYYTRSQRVYVPPSTNDIHLCAMHCCEHLCRARQIQAVLGQSSVQQRVGNNICVLLEFIFFPCDVLVAITHAGTE